eukprot:13662029-Ditylum_brightwellii.AAC.1
MEIVVSPMPCLKKINTESHIKIESRLCALTGTELLDMCNRSLELGIHDGSNLSFDNGSELGFDDNSRLGVEDGSKLGFYEGSELGLCDGDKLLS